MNDVVGKVRGTSTQILDQTKDKCGGPACSKCSNERDNSCNTRGKMCIIAADGLGAWRSTVSQSKSPSSKRDACQKRAEPELWFKSQRRAGVPAHMLRIIDISGDSDDGKEQRRSALGLGSQRRSCLAQDADHMDAQQVLPFRCDPDARRHGHHRSSQRPGGLAHALQDHGDGTTRGNLQHTNGFGRLGLGIQGSFSRLKYRLKLACESAVDASLATRKRPSTAADATCSNRAASNPKSSVSVRKVSAAARRTCGHQAGFRAGQNACER